MLLCASYSVCASEMPPLYKYPPVPGINKAEHQQQPADNSPLKPRILEDNNDKKLEENGLDGCNKMVKESDTNKYLHKKFKKIATLEETSPGKAKGVLYPIPEDSQEVRPGSPGNGRYVCPFCKLSCAKPSVLQKHIRAHTNERPYPCLPCGFAFKTKSNLYKHCRSRAHTLKIDGQSSEEEESPPEVKKIYKPKFHLEDLKTTNVTQLDNNNPPRSPFSSLSPSPELLHKHINKLISDNQAIVDDPIWPKIRLTPSPPPRNGESRLAIALTKSITPDPIEEPQPLNLTVKEPRKRSLSETMISKGSIIKDILLKTRDKPDLSKMTEMVLHPCPNCKVVFRTLENLNTHLYSCKPKSSPGPLLGKTPLVDSFKDIKKRKVDFGPKIDEKAKSVKLFGGEVQILDSPTGEAKTLRIESGRKTDSYVDTSAKKDTHVLTISKTGLHSVGGTMIQSESVSPKPVYAEKMVLPIMPNVAPPNIPGMSTPVQLRFPPGLNPLTSITAFNPLTLPPTTLSPLKRSPSPFNGGVVTILHAGKAIPFVQGIPGPNSLLATQPLIPKKPEKSVIVKPALQKLEVKPLPPLRVETDDKSTNKDDAKEMQIATSTEVGEKKFLRPSSLPLKPGTYTPKRSLTTPNAIALVSPETPRPRKSYGQLYLNGHAYTYLGLKCSTKMFFCTLNKPQPIYVPLSPDQYKISMYSNWKICSDSSPTPPGLDTRKAMSYYDSRNRHSCYTMANRNKQDLMTHSTFHSNRELRSETDKASSSGKNEDDNENNSKRIKVCEGGFESNEEYIYVRGRGRGRYVCEECGIRCKKPSMLKKHIRTHTDLRPYTCKYCTFSFKTKGNLTKHMKSKSHYKKCVELDVSPVPVNIDDSYLDEDNNRQEGDQLSHGLLEEESEEETDDDEDDDDDEEDSVDEGEDCKIEHEAARSLLSLSEVTLETAHRQFISAGLISSSSRPRTYPYTYRSSPTPDDEDTSDRMMLTDSWRKDLLMLTKDCRELSIDSPHSSAESLAESSRPMDLSNKPIGCAKTSVITSVGGPAMLTTINSAIDRIPSSLPTPTSEYPEDSQLLHAYLTERAVRDSKIKQHQLYDRKNEDDESPKKDEADEKMDVEPERVICILTPPVESPNKSPPTSKLPGSPNKQLKAEFFPPSSGPGHSYLSTTEDGRSMCGVCNKVFNKPSQLRLHINIHYFERPYRCEACAVSFRTKGHLQKHQRSLGHMNKVNMNSTFGTATTSNPRPFKCEDCKVAFRIHGHLAKHFRSKMHIMKLECLGKLPFGTYAELERSGVNMNDIDTTDCENSLESLQLLAMKLAEKDSLKSSTDDSDGSGWKRVAFCESPCGSEDEAGSKKNNNATTIVQQQMPPQTVISNAKEPSASSKFQMNNDKCNPNDDGVR